MSPLRLLSSVVSISIVSVPEAIVPVIPALYEKREFESVSLALVKFPDFTSDGRMKNRAPPKMKPAAKKRSFFLIVPVYSRNLKFNLHNTFVVVSRRKVKRETGPGGCTRSVIKYDRHEISHERRLMFVESVSTHLREFRLHILRIFLSRLFCHFFALTQAVGGYGHHCMSV